MLQSSKLIGMGGAGRGIGNRCLGRRGGCRLRCAVAFLLRLAVRIRRGCRSRGMYRGTLVAQGGCGRLSSRLPAFLHGGASGVQRLRRRRRRAGREQAVFGIPH